MTKQTRGQTKKHLNKCTDKDKDMSPRKSKSRKKKKKRGLWDEFFG